MINQVLVVICIVLLWCRVFDSVDRKASAKVLSLYGVPDKYIKVICAMYENNTGKVEVGNEVSN